MTNENSELLELTPSEQQAADRDAALLEVVREAHGPTPPRMRDLFPGAIRISDLVAGASGGRIHSVKLALKKGEEHLAEARLRAIVLSTQGWGHWR